MLAAGSGSGSGGGYNLHCYGGHQFPQPAGLIDMLTYDLTFYFRTTRIVGNQGLNV